MDQVVPEAVRERAAVVVHHGFEETAPVAVARYLRHYGLEEPSFPVLHSELTNPLFLRLACAVTRARGLPGLPRDGFGFGVVFGGYFDVIDERLAGESRCDYDPTDRLVQQAVRQLASAAEHGSFTKHQADQITEALLPNRGWARSLLKGMLDEGLLLRTASGDHERVRFGYERIGDLATASAICELPVQQAGEAVRRLGPAWYANAGVLQALSVLLPETHRLEVVDVASDDEGVDALLLEMLLASLALRRASSVSQRTVELVDRIVDADDCRREVYCAVLLVAAVPGHGLNADWLHRRLLLLGLVERDLTWTTMCNDDRPGALDVLVEWAWSTASAGADDEVARLAAMTLAWCLTSSNRRLRDRSTKALVHLLQQCPAVLVRVLAAFEGVDDPYVKERLLAVAAGVAARCQSREGRVLVGRAVAQATVLAERWPQHLLSRDYARRAVEAAIDAGWDAPGGTRDRVSPPYGTAWPVSTRTDDEIKVLGGPPEYRYGSIIGSVMSDFGDFHKYVLRHHLSSLAPGADDEPALAVAARRIVDRVLELGWDPERHGLYDRHRSRQPNDRDPTERLGKKYQWIALHETLGAMVDNAAVGGRWGEDERPYDDPSDLRVRDIDPTTVIRTSRTSWYDDSPSSWVNPVTVDFASPDMEEWLGSTEDLPDPARLLRVSASDGVTWSITEGHYQWTERRHPEEELVGNYRRLWYQVRAYVFDAEHRKAVTEWAAEQDLSGRWMPESADNHGVLLADHQYHRTWRFTNGEDEVWGARTAPPTLLVPASALYGSVSDDDKSTSDPLGGFVLPADLYRLLEVDSSDDFNWSSAAGLVAQDPSVRSSAPPSLLVRFDALADACARAGKSVLWTVIGEKQLMDAEHIFRFEDDRLIGMEVQASYLLAEGAIECLGGTTAPRRARAGDLPGAPWTPGTHA